MVLKKSSNILTKKEAKRHEKVKEIINEPHIPDGLFQKCASCNEIIYTEDIIANYHICPECGSYFRIQPRTRLSMVLDKDSFEEWDKNLPQSDPLCFPGYNAKLEYTRAATDLDEAVITGKGAINGMPVAIGAMASNFLMGSMGEVVGEKLTRLIEGAVSRRLPLIIFCSSGGARMQEGIVSLMQMAKTSGALKRFDEAGLLYISVLTDPTTGGVMASFAMLGDVIIAEPGALAGFAGPRVIEQTIGQKLPEGFQRAEFLLEHGFVDKIVKRSRLRNTLAFLIESSIKAKPEMESEASPLRLKGQHTGDFTMKSKLWHNEAPLVKTAVQGVRLSAWERVKISRGNERPTSIDYISRIFDKFMELHGDRLYRDDGAIIGGIANIGNEYVTIIGQQKGRNIKQNMKRNFGMANPDGYRKALRLMKQAEKFGRPIICFIDTPGAFCGIEAEERGQGEAIARNLFEMSALKVPVLAVLIGEGGSGGALGIAVANEVWMLENATYSILSPEGFSSILWKDSKRADEAADIMKITAEDLEGMEIIDHVILEEPDQAAEEDIGAEETGRELKKDADEEDGIPAAGILTTENMVRISEDIKERIADFIARYKGKSGEDIAEQRYQRFRRM